MGRISRLRKLPIYVTDRDTTNIDGAYEKSGVKFESLCPVGTGDTFHWEVEKHVYPLFSKDAKERAPEARQYIFQITKKYPSVLSHMERTNPKAVVVSHQRRGKSPIFTRKDVIFLQKPHIRMDSIKEIRDRLE
jgi:hypothetical protein